MPETAPMKEPEPVVVRREPERDLVVWQALARPFKRRERKFYVTVISLVGIVSLILFLAEGAMPVILLVSLLFLFYIMNTVPPETIEYKITTKGISMAGKKMGWNLLGRFWFSQKGNQEVLTIESANFPGRLEFIIVPEKKEEIKKALSSYLPEEEIPPSALEKAAGWISKRLPDN
ncbi:hypothetical protein COY30_01495 [Candidatus Woesebacteria bacterium CG_4_10_14_0_2_um_filter_44_9]|uniref:DUF5673 domain-containing protein n=2 Tax=Candidatus Woeseibacteriota TaxID=1752722 RepID=A0A2M7THF5_9BACT|nr:MAG: hypothetical protein COY30_01495 [Candidatus Woesebacteria bacterium CG_4_10_14_0_2_um_filter_44_9]